MLHKKNNLFRELEINKLRKFGAGFFISDKAKNAGNAGHSKLKRTKHSSNMRSFHHKKRRIP